MPARKLRDFLDTQGVKYVVVTHSEAFTAQETAASAHIRGKEIAKTVIIQVNGQLAMAVAPASHRIDLERLQAAAGGAPIRLATEEEFEAAFPDCEIGAMPPFGNLYGMKVFVADELARDAEIAFNAGTHRELVKLAYADFERLVRPQVATFSQRR